MLKYRLGHPENYLFTLSKKLFSGSKYLKNILFYFENRSTADDQLMKLSVSLALAQSTRISVQEKQVIDIVMETRDLPIELGKSGKVLLSSEKLAQVIGSVFLQKTALNLQVQFLTPT